MHAACPLTADRHRTARASVRFAHEVHQARLPQRGAGSQAYRPGSTGAAGGGSSPGVSQSLLTPCSLQVGMPLCWGHVISVSFPWSRQYFWNHSLSSQSRRRLPLSRRAARRAAGLRRLCAPLAFPTASHSFVADRTTSGGSATSQASTSSAGSGTLRQTEVSRHGGLCCNVAGHGGPSPHLLSSPRYIHRILPLCNTADRDPRKQTRLGEDGASRLCSASGRRHGRCRHCRRQRRLLATRHRGLRGPHVVLRGPLVLDTSD